ncbi:hypothetical protein KVT40_004657 [Elsinoe batatas]|uniref:Stc1 domain-containing protein n=1 Tax=Elsinoe batatas TaxID=2601811 RepID=A0A8K0L2D6_9PEZI|nr:hypothetical protein KVT40_004657 [Elsinoe batatas]
MAPNATKWKAFADLDTSSTTSGPAIAYNDFVSTAPVRRQYNTRAPFHIPNELTCTLCNKPKNLRGFSVVQQNKYRDSRGSHNIICIHCNGVKKTEITCSLCDKTLPLKKFARSQRSGAQECFDCVAKRTGFDSDDEDYFTPQHYLDSAKGMYRLRDQGENSADVEPGTLTGNTGDGRDATGNDGWAPSTEGGWGTSTDGGWGNSTDGGWGPSTDGGWAANTTSGSEAAQQRGREMPGPVERQRPWVADEERYDLGEDWDAGSVLSVESSDSEGSVFSV